MGSTMPAHTSKHREMGVEICAPFSGHGFRREVTGVLLEIAKVQIQRENRTQYTFRRLYTLTSHAKGVSLSPRSARPVLSSRRGLSTL
jgi:hypothetical protein